MAKGVPIYTTKGSPLGAPVPQQPGDYELRYVTGRSSATLARAKLTVTAASVSLSGPPTVTAGAAFKVTWTGPGGDFDRITIAPKGALDRVSVLLVPSDSADRREPFASPATGRRR